MCDGKMYIPLASHLVKSPEEKAPQMQRECSDWFLTHIKNGRQSLGQLILHGRKKRGGNTQEMEG